MGDQRERDFDADDLEVETLLRELSADDQELLAPPAEVWDAIHAEIGPTTDIVGSAGAAVVTLEDRRKRSKWLVAAAAAATVVVAGIVALTVSGDDDPVVVAGASLEYEPATFDPLGADSAAHVNLVDDDGAFRIEIDDADLSTPADEPADLELWLIQPDADGAVADIVSLGVVDPDDPGSFDVPDSYDPDVFFVVDISVEPRDGVETHSGRSILRAPLDFA